MARKNGRQRSPEEAARRKKIRELLALSGVEGMEDIQQLFRETIAEFMESGLDAEMDEQLGYERYDVQGKETDDSRNGKGRRRTTAGTGTAERPCGPASATQPSRFRGIGRANSNRPSCGRIKRASART